MRKSAVPRELTGLPLEERMTFLVEEEKARGGSDPAQLGAPDRGQAPHGVQVDSLEAWQEKGDGVAATESVQVLLDHFRSGLGSGGPHLDALSSELSLLVDQVAKREAGFGPVGGPQSRHR